MAGTFCMPMRNERAAPTFNSSNPRELPRFFEDLEGLMTRAGITTPADMKKQVLKYVDINTEQIWKTFPEYTTATQTYAEFKQAILDQYPDATGDFIYSMRDMDSLIGERQRIGIATMKDLSDYHVQFMAVTRWLISKEYLAELEQQRAYVRAFQPHFLGLVMNRLAIKIPDHHPNVPYKIKDVHEAARFILQGASVPLLPAAQPSSSSPTSSDGYVKTETLATMMAEFTKTMNQALAYSRPRGNFSRGQQEGDECSYCGGPHYIKNCDKVEDDIKSGKCKRNHEGKVVLPNGFYVSRAVQGKWMRDRIFEWHRQNSSSQPTPTLVHTVEPRLLCAPPSTSATAASTQSTYQLSANDRIAVLEAELFNLRTRKTGEVPAARTRSQTSKKVSFEEVEDEADIAAARAKLRESRIEEIEELRPPQHQGQKAPEAPVPARAPEHPFRNAKDAVYTPPSTKNIGAQDKAPSNPFKRTDPAYKTLPPVHDPAIATSVFQRSMEAPITITQRELLSLSPEVRSQVRDTTTTRRIPTASQNMYEDFDDMENLDFDSLNQTYPVTTFALSDAYNRPIPRDAVIVQDEIESYYRSLGPDEDPDLSRLVVSGDSSAIRSVAALIDNSHRVECILDSGCQIIAMSEAVCHELGLAYDPSIVLHMQSANGTLDQSLGLSRNVPFQIGKITMYLQVHVISSPAYDVLLGRPFDVLTESVVRNFSNEDQTITIQDPNTGRRVTVPTFPRTRKVPKCTHPRHAEHNRLAYDNQDF
jgi:hypothetical protein